MKRKINWIFASWRLAVSPAKADPLPNLSLLFSIYYAEQGYSFNTQGNLEYRQDTIAGYKETFAYDSMNRLTDWAIYNNSNVLQAASSLAYHSTTGLISAMSNLGNATMNYGENGSPPHALTSIAGTPGMIPSEAQAITYTDFRKVKQITEGSDMLNITYGTDEQRIKTVLTNPSGTLTRYYMGHYEEEIRGGSSRNIHYINGGNGLAAIYVQNGRNDTLYYAHTDYQGSLTALSLANGTVIERYAYDPWGIRRNPANWTQQDMRTAFIFNRGYTLHEHLPEFNLINMNGRVYDPLTAQFFSPDPYLQAPGDWVNYNRYAYCLNNPFKYVDPSGEIFYINFGIGWSKQGGLSFSFGVGIGFKNYLSAGISVDYEFGSNSLGIYGNVGYAGSYASAGYNTSAGWTVGTGYSYGAQVGPFSFSVFSAGGSYSQNGGFFANAGWVNYNQYGGFSMNPSFGVSATGRWGIEYSVLESSESIGVVNKDRASITTDNQLHQLLDQRGINYADYYASDVSIEKQIPNQIEGRNTDLYNRYRRHNGVIYSLENGQSVGGMTVSLLNGFKRPYSLIYMSTHDTNRNLMISLNHEFIHSWQYAKFGHSNRREWDRFAEASAYRYTQMYHPSVSVPTYFGPWFPLLYTWPKLPY